MFTTDYWRSAKNNLTSIRMLTLASVFIALKIAVGTIFIPLPLMGTQRIYFTFFIDALGGYLYGPFVALLVGFISDIMGAVFFPSGMFFFGYTLTSMAGALCYALFLYRQKITLPRLACCKLVINLCVNVGMNSLWDSILIGKAYQVLLLARIPKNLILWPIEVTLLWIFFRYMKKILEKRSWS